MESRDVLRHHAPSTYCATSPDRHIWTYRHVPTEPAVLANSDWTPELWTVDAVAEEGVEGVGGGEERATRTDQSASANGDNANIEERAVEVDVNSLPDAAAAYEKGLVRATGGTYRRLVP